MHGGAFNALVWGEKHWLLLPPRAAAYSTVPAAAAFAEALSAGEGKAAGGVANASASASVWAGALQ